MFRRKRHEGKINLGNNPYMTFEQARIDVLQRNPALDQVGTAMIEAGIATREQRDKFIDSVVRQVVKTVD